MNDTRHYLLDTDMCIYLLNGHPRVKARVAQVGIAALAVALPTVGELYFGAYNSGRVESNVVLMPAADHRQRRHRPIHCHERLGGLLKYYDREAA